jgi:hypothetical protein
VRLHVIALPDALHHHARNAQLCGHHAGAPVRRPRRSSMSRAAAQSNMPALDHGSFQL